MMTTTIQRKYRFHLLTVFPRVAAFALVAAIAFSSCGKGERQEQMNMQNTTYSKADSLVGNAIMSVDWNSVYYGEDEAREQVLGRLNTLLDSLEQAGDMGELGADYYRGIIYNQAYKRVEAEEWFAHAVTHNSRKDRMQWYYNHAG